MFWFDVYYNFILAYVRVKVAISKYRTIILQRDYKQTVLQHSVDPELSPPPTYTKHTQTSTRTLTVCFI